MPHPEQPSTFQGLHCSITVRRPTRAVVVVVISGRDVGELGDAPFRALEQALLDGPVALFIDARETSGASVAVSHEWAQWLAEHRARLASIDMLTGSKFVQLTADFVRRFAELGDLMRVYTDPHAFDELLATATRV